MLCRLAKDRYRLSKMLGARQQSRIALESHAATSFERRPLQTLAKFCV